MLDYAANGLTYWTVDRLRRGAAETAQQREIDAAQRRWADFLAQENDQ